MPLDRGILVYPPLVIRESRPISSASRTITRVGDLWRWNQDLSKQVANVPDGTAINVTIGKPVSD